jgi:hypothetical protein
MLHERYTANEPVLANLDGNGVIKGWSDLVVLRYMVKQLQLTLQTTEVSGKIQLPLQYNLTERVSAQHRIIIFDPQELQTSEKLSFVGFVSAYRSDIDPAITDELGAVDTRLLPKLTRVRGLLGYLSMELRPGYWYNLVVLRSLATKSDLKQLPIHQYAAYDLAPRVYKWIRIHNGVFVGSLTKNTPELLSTKHYVFQDAEPYFQMYEVNYENSESGLNDARS